MALVFHMADAHFHPLTSPPHGGFLQGVWKEAVEPDQPSLQLSHIFGQSGFGRRIDIRPLMQSMNPKQRLKDRQCASCPRAHPERCAQSSSASEEGPLVGSNQLKRHSLNMTQPRRLLGLLPFHSSPSLLSGAAPLDQMTTSWRIVQTGGVTPIKPA